MKTSTPTSTATTARAFFQRPLDQLAAFFLTLIIAGFHFYFLLNAGGLWRDEVNLLNLSGQSSLSALAKDSFPVLMPLVLKAWGAVGLGQSDGLLRLLGLLIGLGSLGGLWLVARQAQSSPPLISLVLLGLNSTFITFGDSLRAYGLGSLLIIYLTAAVLFFLNQPNWRRTGLVALLAVLSVQTLFHNAVLVGALCLSGIAVCLRRRDRRAAGQLWLAGASAAISLLPYVPNLLASQASSIVLRTGFSWPRFWDDISIAFGFPQQPYIYVWALLGSAVIGLGLKAIFTRQTSPAAADNLRLFSAVTLLLAPGGFLLFLWATGMPGQPWYYLPLMALAAICFDIVNVNFSRRIQHLILAGTIITALLALPVAKRDLNYRFTNLDTWAQALQATAQPGDYILVIPWFCGITFDHYYRGTTPWDTIPPLEDHTTHRYDLVHTQLQNTNALQPVLKKIHATLASAHRVWLLAPRGALQIPPRGHAAPADLPPAPSPKTGWADEPYAIVWAGQTMQYLSTHSCEFNLVNQPAPHQRLAENLELFLAQGSWPTTRNVESDAK